MPHTYIHRLQLHFHFDQHRRTEVEKKATRAAGKIYRNETTDANSTALRPLTLDLTIQYICCVRNSRATHTNTIETTKTRHKLTNKTKKKIHSERKWDRQ